MKIIPAKTPGFVKSLFPNFTWHIETEEKVLYLTFDDGPTPEVTDWVLKTLNQYHAKATFFCIGNNITKHPDVYSRVIKEGHSVGNHTHNHLKGWKVKTKHYLADVELASEVINSQLFRPPYGKFKTKQSKQLIKSGYQIVMWDVLSFDWDAKTSQEACLKNVIGTAKEGSIVVFHDSHKAWENLSYVLPRVLDYYSEKGYTFKAL